jgi:hypothetical protein
VQAGADPQTYNYTEMGFEDKRTGKPNQEWALLRELAKERGEMAHGSRNGKDFMAKEKRMERMRKRLRTQLKIASDPILRDETGYHCRFKLRLAPAFEK